MNTDETLQKHLTELEERLAWLEDQLNTQGQELTKSFEEIAFLKSQLADLVQKNSDPYITRALKDEVPPPHY